MDIYIKTFNSESENPNSFTLSSNIGSITPSTASLNELLDGKIFSLSDENATQVTLSAQGFESKVVNINKEAANCFQTSAVNFTQGNTRATDRDGNAAPFRTSTVSPGTVSNILDLNNGDQFSLQIFENLVNLTIFNKTTTGTNEIIIEATGSNNDFFFLSKDISTNEIRFFYESPLNTGSVKYSSIDSKAKEWVASDFIITC
jgi:hypothetical protein